MTSEYTPTRRGSRLPALVISILWLAGCSGQAIHTIHAAYSLLAPAQSGATTLYARVIVDPGRERCPTLIGAAKPIEMSQRDNPAAFPVAVCEAVIPFEQALSVAGTEITIAAVTKNPKHILVYGNSGAKLAKGSPKGTIPAFDIGGRKVFGNAAHKHGFMVMHYQPDGSWHATVLRKNGRPMATCSSAHPPTKAVCELTE